MARERALLEPASASFAVKYSASSALGPPREEWRGRRSPRRWPDPGDSMLMRADAFVTRMFVPVLLGDHAAVHEQQAAAGSCRFDRRIRPRRHRRSVSRSSPTSMFALQPKEDLRVRVQRGERARLDHAAGHLVGAQPRHGKCGPLLLGLGARSGDRDRRTRCAIETRARRRSRG